MAELKANPLRKSLCPKWLPQGAVLGQALPLPSLSQGELSSFLCISVRSAGKGCLFSAQ